MPPVFNNDSLDDQILFELCQSFSGGQNSFTRASLVQDPQASYLQNVTISINGEVKKRRGTRNVFSGFIAGENVRIQAIIFLDTVATENLVAIAGGSAYYFDGLNWQTYFAAAIPNVNEIVSLVQLTDSLYWTDSSKTGVRRWNGSTVSTIAGSPAANILEVHTNRLVASGVTAVPDGIYFSDILDPQTWDLTNKAIRIGGGDGGAIMAIKSWQDTFVVALRAPGYGVYLIDANPLQSVANFSVKAIHKTIGCVAARTACQVGQDLWFLSRNGVMSIQKQLATSNNQIAVPVSQPIQDIIDMIRWDMAYKSVACCYNNYYLLSVPVDNDEPDVVIVHNYLTGGWVVFSNLDAGVFIEEPFEGKTRLLMGCHNGELREWLDYLLDSEVDFTEDFKDGLNNLFLPLTLPTTFPPGDDTESIVLTRAMTFGEPLNPKSGFYGEAEIIQLGGEVEVAVVRDGGEKEVIETYEFEPSNALPTTLPLTLRTDSAWLTKRFPLHHLHPFRELQYKITSSSGNFAMRRLMASAFLDTIELNSQ